MAGPSLRIPRRKSNSATLALSASSSFGSLGERVRIVVAPRRHQGVRKQSPILQMQTLDAPWIRRAHHHYTTLCTYNAIRLQKVILVTGAQTDQGGCRPGQGRLRRHDMGAKSGY